jgi:hypothetical protein
LYMVFLYMVPETEKAKDRRDSGLCKAFYQAGPITAGQPQRPYRAGTFTVVLPFLSVAPVAPKAPCGPAKPGVRAQPAVKPSDMSAAAIGLRLVWCVGATLHILHHPPLLIHP